MWRRPPLRAALRRRAGFRVPASTTSSPGVSVGVAVRALSSSQSLYVPPPPIPSEARVVVMGGGIIGTSVAYHLAHSGVKDVVLLERDQLTSGTTWHAAGLMVTFGSLSETSTDMRKYTKQLYGSLEAETGQSTGFMPVGFIEVATNTDRLEEYRRIAAFNRKCGVDVREVSPAEVQALFPLARVDDVLAGFYVEDDGRVNPVDATMALAKGARAQGATILEGVSVADVTTRGGAVTGVVATRRVEGTGAAFEDPQMEERQHIRADYVVNCGGMWARQLAESHGPKGVIVPNQAAEHYYLLTEPMDDVDPSWPVLEDPSSYAYIRPEGGGLMVGLFEGRGAAWKVDVGIPSSFSFGEIEPDWDRLGPYLEQAMGRVPRTLEVGAKKFFCGPESFTPDLGPVVGESPELRNYFVAAGLNSIGILTGGGVGRAVAHWVKTGLPDVDVTGMNVDRFQAFHAAPAFRRSRVVESLGDVYKCHYPHKPKMTARDAKRTPLYEPLKKAGAVFRDVSGWECADWFVPPTATPEGPDPDPIGPLSFGKHKWFDHWRDEHNACRSAAALIDMSFMSKFLVQGPGAGALLDRLSTSSVDAGVLPGTITYTQWLNRTGRLEADLTVTKLPSQHQYQQQHTSGWEGSDGGGGGGSHDFMVVATDTMHRHVESWMKRHIAALDAHSGMGGGGVGLSESDGNDSGSLNWNGGNPGLDGNGEAVTWGNITADGSNAYATVTDVTGALAQLNLQGPLSRAILARAIAGEPPVGSGGGGGGSGSGEGEAGVGEGTEEVFEEDPACAHEREEAAAYAVSDEAFPFRAAKECYIGFARCTVTRITYVGELGYEIFAPAEQASQVLEVLHAAARRLGREQLVFLDEGIAAEDPEGIGAGAAGGSGSGGSIGGIGGEGGQPRKVVQGPRYWAERLAAGGVPYAGLKALGSLRMEKGYRDYGHDLDNTDSLAEGGLAFTANLARVTKHTGHFSPAFIGSDKMAAQKERGVKELPRRLVGVLLTPKKKTTAAAGGEGAAQDDRGGAGAGAGTAAASSDGGDASDGAAASDGGGGADAEGVSGGASGEGAAGEGGDESEETAFMFHGEVVLRDGEVVGDVRAASYGHTLGGAVGLAMIERGDTPLTKKYFETGTWEVDIAGVRHPAIVSLAPLYDPKNTKIKA